MKRTTIINVAVCRKSDYENDAIGDGIFLVKKEEWKADEDIMKYFDLFLTNVKKKEFRLLPTRDQSLPFFRRLPLEKRSDYKSLPGQN